MALLVARFYFVYLYRGTAVPLVFHSKHSLSSVQDLQAVVLGQCISIRSNGMMDSFMARYNHYSQSVIRSQPLGEWRLKSIDIAFKVVSFQATEGISSTTSAEHGLSLELQPQHTKRHSLL